MKRAILGGLLALAFLLPVALQGRDSQAQTPPTLTVIAGNGDTGYAVNAFLPDVVNIPVNGQIHWTFPWQEPHSLTIGIPAGDPSVPSHPGQAVVSYDGTGWLSSGLLWGAPGDSFDVKFTKAGATPSSASSIRR